MAYGPTWTSTRRKTRQRNYEFNVQWRNAWGARGEGWSRQEAIDFFKDNAAKTEQDIVNEIDRYLIMPGQALAYKIGQLKLLELKQRAKNQLGDQFDIKEFHHTVLSQGALPLAILEERMDEYLLEVK